MKFFLTTFLFYCGFFLPARAWDGNTKYVAPEKKNKLLFYSGISFLKYPLQPGLLELSFDYSRLDTATGGQIPESFYYSKKRVPGNHSFTLPVVGLEFRHENIFLRADIRFPQRRRISQQHFSLGYEWRGTFKESPHRFSLLAGVNGIAPDWVSSVFIRGEIGIEIYKPVWLLDELPVDDTTFYVMGYTIKKSDSDVRSLGVYYEEDVVALIPSLTFGFGTSQNKIDFALTFSPFVPISEKGGIRLLYKKNNTGWIDPYTWFWYPFKSIIEPGQRGFVAKYDGAEVSKTPYRFSGMEIFLRIGIRLR